MAERGGMSGAPVAGWRLVDKPGLEHLVTGVLISTRNQWWHATWEQFNNDPASPWFSLPPLAQPLGTVLIAPEQVYRTHRRQQLWPAGLIHVLRLLGYHPKVLGGKYAAGKVYWDAPLVLCSWLRLDDLLRMKPNLRFLLAPSVRHFLPSDFDKACECALAERLPRSNETELHRYFLAEMMTDFSSHHHLGNAIGPLIIADHIRLSLPQCTGDKPMQAESLSGIFYQKHKAKTHRPMVSSSALRSLKECILTSAQQNATANLRVTVFDDHFREWRPIWEALLKTSPEDGFEAIASLAGIKVDDVLTEIRRASTSKGNIDSSLRPHLLQVCSTSALVIVDVRLLPEEAERPVSPYFSGLVLLRSLYECGLHGQSVPILAFSSSRRQDLERWAYDAKADCFLSKPSSFDQVAESVRFLAALAVYLHPAFRLLRNLWTVLSTQSAAASERLRHTAPSDPAEIQLRRLRNLTDDLQSEIRLLRDTLAPAVLRELAGTDTVALSSARSSNIHDSTSVLRSTFNAVEAYLTALEAYGAHGNDDRIYVLRHLRNMCSHDSRVKFEDAGGLPALGIASLALAVDFVLQGGKARLSTKNVVWNSGACATHRRGTIVPKSRHPVDNQLRTLQALDWLSGQGSTDVREICEDGIARNRVACSDHLFSLLRRRQDLYTNADNDWRVEVANRCPRARPFVVRHVAGTL